MDLFSARIDVVAIDDSNTRNRNLCIDLLRADTEAEVIRLLSDAGYWSDDSAWHPYGDVESNYSTIGNQTEAPETALVEKLVNSVDAVLTVACLERHIDPEGPAAPPSMAEALADFFGVPAGKLANLDKTVRTSLAQNIFLVATGSHGNPCLTVIDQGEGQIPSAFPDTFLSLHKSNKTCIPFVQGQFDMGGTAALPFCGEKRIELIISRRHPEAVWYRPKEIGDAQLWGFTVVRRRLPTGQMKNSVFEYLAPAQRVLTFDADSINALPDAAQGTAWVEPLNHGTIVKLYNYQLLRSYRTNIKLDLSYRLSFLLPDIGMPVRVVECRDYGGHSPGSTLAGLTVRLKDDRSKVLEGSFPGSLDLTVDGEHMTATIYAFKKGEEVHYLDKEGIVLVRSGQRRDGFAREFFVRKSVNLSYVARSVLVVVDCTKLSRAVAEDFFMNSRDRARRVPFRENLERELESQLQHHQGLRELNARRREQELQGSLANEKPLQEVLGAVLSRLPELAKLLMEGERLSSPATLTKASTAPVFVGKRFPTYFTLVAEHALTGTKQVPRNHRFRVQFKTDAENDFFSRDDEPGTFDVCADGSRVAGYSLNLWNGTATLTASLPADCKIGQLIKYGTKVVSADRVFAFESDFAVLVEPDQIYEKGSSGRRKGPSGSEKTGDNQHPSRLALPPVNRLHRDELAARDMSVDDALKVVSADSGYDFYLNMDNPYLDNERRRNPKVDPRILDSQFECGLVLVALMLLNSTTEPANDDGSQHSTTVDDVRHITKILAPIMLPIARVVGGLGLQDVSEPLGTDGDLPGLSDQG
jgi:hypothetical protein